MKFWEAMKALEEGKMVRCKQWAPSWYACLQGNEFDRRDPLDAYT